MGPRFLAACAQMRCQDDPATNVAAACRLVAEAGARGAALVVLPEMFHWRGPQERDAEVAEGLDGDCLGRLAESARANRLTLVAGSILERHPGGELPFNTTVVFGPAGERLGVYRKIHMFDVDLTSGPRVRESERLSAGAEPVCVDTPVGRLGLSICYDLRFPELYRRLVDAGADILCVPSAFTFTTGSAHWETLLRARAIESQCWVLAPNQGGPVAHGPEVWGHTQVVDPWGVVVAKSGATGEALVLATIDPEQTARVRAQLPSLRHRRIRG